MKDRCPWIWRSKRCPNKRSSVDATLCGNHHQLERQIAGFIRMRAYVVSARKLLREAQTVDRDEVYTSYIPGCRDMANWMSTCDDGIYANIIAMDEAWLKARPGLERKAFQKVFEDS